MSSDVDNEFGTMRGSVAASREVIAMEPRLVGRQGCALNRKPGNGSGLISGRLPAGARVYDSGEQ
jgi:hypothetical protein